MPVLHVQDPVCGSAHCSLAVYWAKKLGKSDFVAYMVLSLSLSSLSLSLGSSVQLNFLLFFVYG